MREPARKYTDLIVWQKAMASAKVIYRVTEAFPRAEMYGLTAQIRRCAVSIPSNIAEGFGRRGAGQFGQFLTIARGSIFELETQMLLAKEVGFLRDGDYEKVSTAVDEVERMLDALLRKVRGSR
jgi:four helix bundle protein